MKNFIDASSKFKKNNENLIESKPITKFKLIVVQTILKSTMQSSR